MSPARAAATGAATGVAVLWAVDWDMGGMRLCGRRMGRNPRFIRAIKRGGRLPLKWFSR
ncbi:hypothetical protein AZA_40576 [Nitrospirillum viridazoti Y2]|nr:hypothetical protein AZA_40576 [Nitrospirillum amazonense Y2]